MLPTDKSQLSQEFLTLVEIVAALRGPNGCPWDKEQTQGTLTQYAIEEAHELAEAIESGNQQEIKDELGDFFFQVLLQSQVASDEKHFNLSQVMKNLSEKLVRRHPHVFSDTKVKNTEEVWKNWETLKSQEKIKPVFSYPKNLPALQAAYKIGVKSKGYKFDWNSAGDVLEKVREELRETEEAISLQKKEKVEEEIGDLLFSIAQLARHWDLEPEQTLRKANKKFENRFNLVLKISGKSKDEFAALPDSEKEELWKKAKSASQATPL